MLPLLAKKTNKKDRVGFDMCTICLEKIIDCFCDIKFLLHRYT